MKVFLWLLAAVFVIPEVIVINAAIDHWWPGLGQWANIGVFALVVVILTICGFITKILFTLADEV